MNLSNFSFLLSISNVLLFRENLKKFNKILKIQKLKTENVKKNQIFLNILPYSGYAIFTNLDQLVELRLQLWKIVVTRMRLVPQIWTPVANWLTKIASLVIPVFHLIQILRMIRSSNVLLDFALLEYPGKPFLHQFFSTIFLHHNF